MDGKELMRETRKELLYRLRELEEQALKQSVAIETLTIELDTTKSERKEFEAKAMKAVQLLKDDRDKLRRENLVLRQAERTYEQKYRELQAKVSD